MWTRKYAKCSAYFKRVRLTILRQAFHHTAYTYIYVGVLSPDWWKWVAVVLVFNRYVNLLTHRTFHSTQLGHFTYYANATTRYDDGSPSLIAPMMWGYIVYNRWLEDESDAMMMPHGFTLPAFDNAACRTRESFALWRYICRYILVVYRWYTQSNEFICYVYLSRWWTHNTVKVVQIANSIIESDSLIQ